MKLAMAFYFMTQRIEKKNGNKVRKGLFAKMNKDLKIVKK